MLTLIVKDLALTKAGVHFVLLFFSSEGNITIYEAQFSILVNYVACRTKLKYR
jgi:hypothetical protein